MIKVNFDFGGGAYPSINLMAEQSVGKNLAVVVCFPGVNYMMLYFWVLALMPSLLSDDGGYLNKKGIYREITRWEGGWVGFRVAGLLVILGLISVQLELELELQL